MQIKRRTRKKMKKNTKNRKRRRMRKGGWRRSGGQRIGIIKTIIKRRNMPIRRK